MKETIKLLEGIIFGGDDALDNFRKIKDHATYKLHGNAGCNGYTNDTPMQFILAISDYICEMLCKVPHYNTQIQSFEDLRKLMAIPPDTTTLPKHISNLLANVIYDLTGFLVDFIKRFGLSRDDGYTYIDFDNLGSGDIREFIELSIRILEHMNFLVLEVRASIGMRPVFFDADTKHKFVDLLSDLADGQHKEFWSGVIKKLLW